MIPPCILHIFTNTIHALTKIAGVMYILPKKIGTGIASYIVAKIVLARPTLDIPAGPAGANLYTWAKLVDWRDQSVF